MRLYATSTSEKHGRVSKIGGNEYLEILIANGNAKTARVRVVHEKTLGETHYILESFHFGKWYPKGAFCEYENVG